MLPSMLCISKARLLKRKNGHLTDDDGDETSRQTKKTRRDFNKTHSNQEEESSLSDTDSERQYRVPQYGPKAPKNQPIRSSRSEKQPAETLPLFPLKTDTIVSLRTFPQEIWDKIVCYVAQLPGINWSYKLLDNLDDPYHDPDGGEWLIITRTLHSLTLTSRFAYQSAIKALYRSICIRSAKSAVFLFRTLKRRSIDRCPNNALFRHNIYDYIQELILIGSVAEYKCCKLLAAQEWPCGASSNSFTIYKAIERWESWKGLSLQRKGKDSLEPIVASAMMADLFWMSPQLHTLAISNSFFPHRSAYECLDAALRNMDTKAIKGNNRCKSHVFPQLSTLILLGAGSNSIMPIHERVNWMPLFHQHSKYGIKKLHFARLGSLEETMLVPSSVEELQLSHLVHGYLDLRRVKNLTVLEIYFSEGEEAAFYTPIIDDLSALPTSLTTLRIDSGHTASFTRTPRLDLSRLTRLINLQVPMALLFENPDHMGDQVVADIFPPMLSSLVLQEVWPTHLHCGDNCNSYGDKMATFLEHAVQGLLNLESLEFQEQWGHWRYALADRQKGLPKVIITPLFPETLSFLCQRASAYMRESTLTALSLVSMAISLEPGNRKALILQAQIQAALGRPKEAAEIIASIGPPVLPYIKEPIERMLARLETARRNLFNDPERAIRAIEGAMQDMRGNNHPPEWSYMLSHAYLLLPPELGCYGRRVLGIAMQLICRKKDDIDALLLAARASCKLKEYNNAFNYLQKASCYSPMRSDVSSWLEAVKSIIRLQ